MECSCCTLSLDKSKRPQRVHHYRPYENELDLKGISFLVDINQIEKSEKQNNLNFNIIGYESSLTPQRTVLIIRSIYF